MRSIGFVARCGIGFLLCLGLVSCEGSSGWKASSSDVLSVLNMGERAKIRDIQKQKNNHTVHVQGKIGAQVPLIGGQRVYELHDDTGSIWIVTQDSLPSAGTQISVQGKVRYQQILIGGQDQSTVYIEQRGSIEVVPASRKNQSSAS